MARPNKATAPKPDIEEPSEERLAALAKALGHPARIGIIKMLHERKSCIGCDIVDEIGLAQSTTSEHLRILKAAGIIKGDIEPPKVCYSLNVDHLAPLIDFLSGLSDAIADASPTTREVA